MDQPKTHFYYSEDLTLNTIGAFVPSGQNSAQGKGHNMSRGPSNGSYISNNSYTTYSPVSTQNGNFSPATPEIEFDMSAPYEYSDINHDRCMDLDGYAEPDGYLTEYGCDDDYAHLGNMDTSHGLYNVTNNNYSYASHMGSMEITYEDDTIPRMPVMRATIPEPEHANEGHMCLIPACNSKTVFKRKADLQRHYDQVHQSSHLKKQYFCDYPRCERSKEPFHRMDHFRDHYRDFHKEDLPRKSGESNEWYAEKAEKASRKWWRCTKCLTKIAIKDYAFVCIQCNTPCDAPRQSIRGYQ
ncbi:hypothetical protein BKA67DRAFT_657524 [Truncatella angustata]|uniref:C2H2-type domain-containing protein n=1 Tax=Truncatella angustata TaxID=152316 RepID=A0A9P8UPC0_9PEZI|nr:uncharacterized protein BKA67DRAFT_657524 [Truncatella angustata]KAH6655594.1 hypothetical protein BKA67DRAFT_657524 [Truncatella angustata]